MTEPYNGGYANRAVIAAEVRGRREALGMSCTALARLASCSVEFVCLLENGAGPGHSVVIPRVLRALDSAEATGYRKPRRRRAKPPAYDACPTATDETS